MTRAILPLLALLGLAACQTPPPPPRPVARAPARVAPTPAPVDGAWSFSILADRCTARVAHQAMALAITAGPAQRVSVSLTGRGLPAGRAVRIGFQGDGGRWQLPGRADARRTATASLPLDSTGSARLQDLLGGGTVTAIGTAAPALVVPDAGVAGRDWYGCVTKLGDD